MKKVLLFLVIILSAHNVFAQEDLDSQYATDMLKVGTKAPKLVNEGVNLLDMMAGKYTILEFWASWCGDCRADMKHVREINSRFCGDSIQIVGFSFDRERAAFDKCVKDSALTWHTVLSEYPMRKSPVAEAYHVKWIPSYYVIDPQGNIILATVMVEKVARKLEQLTLCDAIDKRQ